jgi:hypothetical protein
MGPDAFSFLLSPPPDEKTSANAARWHDVVTELVSTRACGGDWIGARFQGAIALDIGLRGRAGRASDVDNVAHRILTAVQAAFAEKPPILAYRVYRQTSSSDHVGFD